MVKFGVLFEVRIVFLNTVNRNVGFKRLKFGGLSLYTTVGSWDFRCLKVVVSSHFCRTSETGEMIVKILLLKWHITGRHILKNALV
jgi:hypothetical protein